MLNLIGVVVAFAVIIILIRKRFNFGLSLLLGSVIVGLFSLEIIEIIDIPKAFIQASFYSFTDGAFFTENIELALLMTFIFMLAKAMQETGAITKLINSLRTFFSKGGIIGVIPAVYGLMPVPGGALFSAPMIDEEGNKFKLKQERKNFLNVWFRHIWFPIYPISSAMILICSPQFSNINIYHLVWANIPAFLIFILIGYVYLRRFVRPSEPIQRETKKDYSGLIFLLPPIIPLLFYAVLQIFGFPQIRSFLIGVIFSLIVLYLLTERNVQRYAEILKKSLTWKLAMALFGIMIFRQMVEVSEANVIIASGISVIPIPEIIVVLLIPLLLGVVTGYNLGAIGLSYALVVPFFPESISIVGITSLIFMSSLVGYLISPIHLCNVLSSEYLKTDTTRMYTMYLPASLALLVAQTIVVLLFLGQ